MDLNQFLTTLLHALSSLDFVEKVDFYNEVFILKGKALLRKNRFLQVYYNERTGTTAFALIEADKRLWGIDFDNVRGWHMHAPENPDGHEEISPKTVSEIIHALKDAWAVLP